MTEKNEIVGRDEVKCSITTTKMLDIRLTIDNVSKIGHNQSVISPDFYLAPGCLFRISFKKDYCIFVYLRNKSDFKITIQRTITLFDYNNKRLYENDARIYSLEKEADVDMVGDLVSYTNFTNDVLIISLCVSIKEIVGKKLNRLLCDTHPVRKLIENLKKMLENPVNSDVSFQLGDERIPVHWSILCFRSPYFKRMFDSGMRESVQNSITVTDLSLGTLKKLIQFLYTADIILGDDLQELFDLYYAADKYEVTDLRILCGNSIMNNVTNDNAGAILKLAVSHNDKDLKMEVMDFIYSNSESVLQTESWKKFEESETAIAELIAFFCMKKNLCICGTVNLPGV